MFITFGLLLTSSEDAKLIIDRFYRVIRISLLFTQTFFCFFFFFVFCLSSLHCNNMPLISLMANWSYNNKVRVTYVQNLSTLSLHAQVHFQWKQSKCVKCYVVINCTKFIQRDNICMSLDWSVCMGVCLRVHSSKLLI